MQHANKMILVPREMMRQQDPADAYVSELDAEMHKILNDKILPPDVKAVRYSQILHRHQKVLEEQKQPFKLNIVEPAVTGIKQGDAHIQTILKNMPPKSKKSAELLIEQIQNNPHITFNKDGELIIDGDKFAGSHIIDLINDFSRERKQQPVTGAEALAKALKQANAPKEAIGNKNRLALFDSDTIFATPTATPTFSSGSSRRTPRLSTKRGSKARSILKKRAYDFEDESDEGPSTRTTMKRLHWDTYA